MDASREHPLPRDARGRTGRRRARRTGRALSRARLGVVALVAALCAAPTSADAGAPSLRTASPWRAPLVDVTVVRPFAEPPRPWDAGHRGVDLTATPGQGVLSPGPGTVTFASRVVGRGVVVVTHPSGLRSSFEPVAAALVPGTPVSAGTVVGTLEDVPGHCAPAACLHWGVRAGERYVDPLELLDPRVILLPLPAGG